jgi:DNA-binding MurR/RpiR family transcriptional regulator
MEYESSANSAGKTKLSSQTTLRRDGSLSSDTDIEEPMVTRFARRLGMSGGDGKKSERSSSNLKTARLAPPPDPDDDIFDEGTANISVLLPLI